VGKQTEWEVVAETAAPALCVAMRHARWVLLVAWACLELVCMTTGAIAAVRCEI